MRRFFAKPDRPFGDPNTLRGDSPAVAGQTHSMRWRAIVRSRLHPARSVWSAFGLLALSSGLAASLLSDRAKQPDFGVGPTPLDCALRDAEGFGHLAVAQPNEEPQF